MIIKNRHFAENEMKGKDFHEESFINCAFTGVMFKFSNFSSCQFNSCNFSGSTFELVNFSDCTFPESKLSFLDFSGSEFKTCNFSESIMIQCIFQHLKEGSAYERKKWLLKGCNFDGAELNQAAFVMCDLAEVSFKNANLDSAVFERCRLMGTDFTGANLNATGFESSTIKNTMLDVDGFIHFGNTKGFILS